MDHIEDAKLEDMGLDNFNGQPALKKSITRRTMIKGLGVGALFIASSGALFGCGGNGAGNK